MEGQTLLIGETATAIIHLTTLPLDESELLTEKQTEIRLYKETVNYLIIPRFYGISKFGNPIKEILSIGEEMLSDISFTYTLLPHQHEATSKTLRVLEKFNGGILSLPCGYGKTGISIYLAIHLKRKTGVIVNKECLADQWIDAINKFTNNKIQIYK